MKTVLSALVLLPISLLVSTTTSKEIRISSERDYSVADLLRHGAVRQPKQQQPQAQVQHIRRLDNDNDGDNGNDDNYEYMFDDDVLNDALINYSAKFLECIPDKKIKNEYGVNTYGGAVLFRLCPTDTCSRKKNMGCNKDYADFAISLQTFMKIFLSNDQYNTVYLDDDTYGAESIGQCGAYNGYVDAGGDNNNEDSEDDENDGGDDKVDYGDLYIGPSCTRDGKGIQLDFYTDYNCTETADISMHDIDTDVWTVPYTNASLVGQSCFSCSGDDENGNNAGDMCTDLYESAAYRCEEKWDFSHYYYDPLTEIYRYGQDNVGCNFINGYNTKANNDVSDVLSLITLIAISVIAWVVYSNWWRKSK